jgi:hypothetical protein
MGFIVLNVKKFVDVESLHIPIKKRTKNRIDNYNKKHGNFITINPIIDNGRNNNS